MRNYKNFTNRIVCKNSKRDSSIDLLRFIGISLIILAHVSAPELLLQLRTFDVPMMFFISGLAYSGKEPDFSIQFLWHRIKRLLFPTYIFITAYYLIAKVLDVSIGISVDVSIKSVLDSYLLIGGIGYLWVIRVFLLVGILTPILLYVESKLKNNKLLFACSLFWLVLFSVMITKEICMEYVIIKLFVYYAASYSILFVWGVRAKKMEDKSLVHYMVPFLFFSLGIIVFFYLANHGHNYAINRYKYPPCWHFVLYGLFMSILLYLIVRKSKMTHINKWIQFIGSNTIWIYFYHIPLVQVFEMIDVHWIIKYLAVFSIAFVFTLLQVSLVEHLLHYNNRYVFLKYLKG